ncbi:isoleucyl-tRNA synthetase [Klebsiella pneumoniae]|uniref:Isoleucyl-tRNA synthetase n=1 Tax=Klebsiella pneumoniae TaxID=573 RepID=A0A378FVP0_KLEPN|nr:isoleucyl-tRNA synthetase [Klebsiella pneumoniae]
MTRLTFRAGDCHGLPIELKVEQEYGKPGEKFTAAEFRAKCREYAAEQIDGQRKDFIRLGVLGDWSHPYLTMDFKPKPTSSARWAKSSVMATCIKAPNRCTGA